MIRCKPTVTVVDDDEAVRKALGRLFKSAGFGVETFASAAEFLRDGLRQRPGCLVLDVRMPGGTGLDLQQTLVESGWHLPIIFITAHEDEAARSLALERGAAAFLQKPFNDRVLLDAVLDAVKPQAEE